MDDLISRQDARRIFEDINTFVSGWWYSALEQIDELPTAEKRGRWVYDEERGATGIYAICTACNEMIYQTGEFNYCPNCGAKMD